MSDRIPCRVSADLSRYMAEQGRLLDCAAYMEQAYEDVIELLMDGKQVGHFRFADILDCEIDKNIRPTVGEIADLMLLILGCAKDEVEHGARRAKLHDFVHGMVERFVESQPELIEERASEIAAADGEPEYEPETD